MDEKERLPLKSVLITTTIIGEFCGAPYASISTVVVRYETAEEAMECAATIWANTSVDSETVRKAILIP